MKKDILVRAGKTFVQAFTATLIVGLTPIITLVVDKGVDAATTAVVALLIASFSAGASALQNFVLATK